MNRREFLLAAPAGAASFCLGCGGDDKPRQKYPLWTTTAGYRFLFADQGSVSTGLYSKQQICDMLDHSIEDAAIHLWRYGATLQDVRAAVMGVGVGVVDHFMVREVWSPTGWAAGSYDYETKTLGACFWQRVVADGPNPPAIQNPWTLHQWPGQTTWEYGRHPRPLPAMTHEIGHIIYGKGYEHGWTPPIVNPPTTTMAMLTEPEDFSWCALAHKPRKN